MSDCGRSTARSTVRGTKGVERGSCTPAMSGELRERERFEGYSTGEGVRQKVDNSLLISNTSLRDDAGQPRPTTVEPLPTLTQPTKKSVLRKKLPSCVAPLLPTPHVPHQSRLFPHPPLGL